MSASEGGTSLVAYWGAGLSTLLACVKLWEVWRDRFQVEVAHNFTSHEIIGNEILIRNLSGKPIILAHWDLFYASRYWHRRAVQHIDSAEHDAGDQRIEPHSTMTLRFAEADYFSWSAKALRGRGIYVRLYVAGKRPIVRLVYRGDA